MSLLHAMLRHDEGSGETGVAGSSLPPAGNVPAAADTGLPTEVGPSASVLYVATNLETWETCAPEPDQDAICEPCGFRRLAPEYYAWLRSRMALAQKRYQAGRLPERHYDELRARFNAVHAWAVERFGEPILLEAVQTLDPRAYRPPAVQDGEEADSSDVVEAAPPAHLYPANGDWRFTEPVSPEAVAKVDAIREQALTAGWSEAQLYQNRGRCSFPCGQDYGLVCFLHGDDRVGEITRQSIEIVNARGTRLRFYNLDVDQPWLRHVRASDDPANRPDTLPTAPVSNY